MKTATRTLASGLAGLALASSLVAPAQTPPAGLRVYTSIEVEFPTEANHYYHLQGSSDLQSWSSIGDAVYGNGQVIRRLFSTRSGEPVNFGTYRIAVVESTKVSHAPADLAGQQLALHDDSGNDLFAFTSSTNGVRHESGDDSFTYHYSKTGENSAEVEVVFDEGRALRLQLQFGTDSQGTYVAERYRDSRLKSRDLGLFGLAALPPPNPTDTSSPTNSTPAPVTTPPAASSAPADLAGRAFSFSAGGEPDLLTFSSSTTGSELEDRPHADDDGGRKPFNYAYSVASPTQASLVVDFGRGRIDAYDLTFTLGEQGSFVRRESRDGKVRDTDRGRFSPAGSTPRLDPSTTPTTGTSTNSSGTIPSPTDSSSGSTNATATATDDHGHGLIPEPGDDKGGNRDDGSGGSTDTTTTPPVVGGSDDTTPGSGSGSTTTEPGDNHGGGEAEPGDDHGGGQAEPGDDRGIDQPGSSPDSVSNPPSTGTGTAGTGTTTPTDALAPASLVGLGLDLGSDLYRFVSASAGVKTGSNTPDPFTYEYLASGPSTASLKVIVKSDRWFEIELRFLGDGTHGTYTQRELRGGALKSEKQGEFVVVR